jgi:phosphomannomutase
MKMYDPVTGLFLGDPEVSPFPERFPSPEAVGKALSGFILSPSGWRKIFAADGSEESREPAISREDTVLAAAAGKVIADFMRSRGKERENPVTPALGIDTRFTGPAVADILIRVFLSTHMDVRYLFIAAAPEIMAHTKLDPGIDGFVYISASHNPVGHNGIKFGVGDGAVLGGRESSRLIAEFTRVADDHSALQEICSRAETVPPADIAAVFTRAAEEKAAALENYTRFTREVITGFSSTDRRGRQEKILQSLRKECGKKPIGILGELNGSARTRSIDRDFLGGLGAGVEIKNGEPGQIVHRIVPEGSSLDMCREELELLYRKDSSFVLGYVPDNDGDRGNIVFIDPAKGSAVTPAAQDVFALAVAAELSYLVWSGLAPVREDGKFSVPVAVAVNGCTSLRIERIVETFGASVFRAEVGEANVVALADKLRLEGYIVRILGEGSNGGNITSPSSVRDPLSTLGALIKILRLTGTAFGSEKTADSGAGTVVESLQNTLDALPRFTTTNSYEPEGVMKIRTEDHGLLKRRYEEIFLDEWSSRKDRLNDMLGIVSWEEVNYEGTEERRGFGPEYRSGKEKGGFTIVFNDERGRPAAYIWMRGSGTEPVFRVLADVEGDNREAHDFLLTWHRDMIEKADRSL